MGNAEAEHGDGRGPEVVRHDTLRVVFAMRFPRVAAPSVPCGPSSHRPRLLEWTSRGGLRERKEV